MKDDYKKYKFSTISFKKTTASRFRKFSKEISKTNTETLEVMLNFFEWNDLSPKDNLGVKNERTNKRINAVIAILKNIEKHQTKPTTIMLQSLFEETTNIKKEEESYEFETPKLISENEELTYYRDSYYAIQKKNSEHISNIETIIKNTKYIKSSFGSDHFRLDITKEAFETIKQKLEDVYHDNPTETRR